MHYFLFSVHLARRVLHLEKVNTSLNKDLEDHQDNVKKLREQVMITIASH